MASNAPGSGHGGADWISRCVRAAHSRPRNGHTRCRAAPRVDDPGRGGCRFGGASGARVHPDLRNRRTAVMRSYSDDFAGRLCDRHEPALLGLAHLDSVSRANLTIRLSPAEVPHSAHPRREMVRLLALDPPDSPTARELVD